jgi:hypothetical protein
LWVREEWMLLYLRTRVKKPKSSSEVDKDKSKHAPKVNKIVNVLLQKSVE